MTIEVVYTAESTASGGSRDDLVKQTHQVCPYPKATWGNIDG
jgi:organic hydroperoxide reductase OsmC/OhrA